MKTPDKTKQDHTLNGIISMIITFIYASLIIFGIISLQNHDWLQRLSGKGKKTEAVTMQTYGDNFLNTGDYEQAINQYDKAISINPQMAEAYSNRGVALKMLKQYDAALQSFTKALEFKNKQQDAAYYNLGEMYRDQNNALKAIEYFYKAAETSPFPMDPYHKAGELLNNTGKWDQSLATFKLAIENSLTIENCYEGMLKRDYFLYDEDIKSKIKALQEAGVNEQVLKSFDKKSFDDALNRNPVMAGICNQMGYAYAMQGDYQTALQNFTRAVQIKPDFFDAQKNLNAALKMINSAGQKVTNTDGNVAQ